MNSLKAAFIVVTLVACGSADTSISNGNLPATQQDSLVTKVKPLAGWRADALVAAFAAIDPQALTTEQKAPAFTSDQLFATIDVSSPIGDVKAQVRVPAGTTNEVKDPNRSKVFFVVNTDADGSVLASFGPFELFSQEGGPCGGFAVNALSCASGLHCQADGASYDVPGVCTAN